LIKIQDSSINKSIKIHLLRHISYNHGESEMYSDKDYMLSVHLCCRQSKSLLKIKSDAKLSSSTIWRNTSSKMKEL